jgi:DNA-binding NtrC family response regulator
LRERPEDVPQLAQRFLAQVAARDGRRPQALDESALAFLAEQTWPGNVRQLKNLLEAATVLCDAPVLSRSDLEDITATQATRKTTGQHASTPGAEAAYAAATFEEFKDLSEKEYLRRKLAENEGNVKRTAERLAMQRSHLYKKIERHGLR